MSRRDAIERLFDDARQGRTAEVAAHLAAGLSPNQRPPDAFFGQQLLHEIVVNDHADTAAAVIACGADVEARDQGDNTPLGHAAMLGLWKVSLILLASGARADQPNRQAQNQETLALQHGHEELADFLNRIGQARGVQRSASASAAGLWRGHGRRLADALGSGDKTLVLDYASAGGDFQSIDAGEAAALFVACPCGKGMMWCTHAAALATALACGAPAGNQGTAGLFSSAAEGLYYQSLILLAAGADPRATDGDGRTAAEIAAANEHHDLAALLGPIADARTLFDSSSALARAVGDGKPTKPHTL